MSSLDASFFRRSIQSKWNWLATSLLDRDSFGRLYIDIVSSMYRLVDGLIDRSRRFKAPSTDGRYSITAMKHVHQDSLKFIHIRRYSRVEAKATRVFHMVDLVLLFNELSSCWFHFDSERFFLAECRKETENIFFSNSRREILAGPMIFFVD